MQYIYWLVSTVIIVAVAALRVFCRYRRNEDDKDSFPDEF
jgi:hypothetical protein